MRALYDSVETREGFIDQFGNQLNSSRIRLTADQVRALNTTPQILVPAPGANKFTQLLSVVFFLDYSGAVFTGANNLEVRETNGAGTSLLVSAGNIAAATLNSAVDIVTEISAELYWDEVTRILNAPLVAVVPVADPGGALSTSVVYLTAIYRTIKVSN